MSVPKHRIPKIKAACPVCFKDNTSTVMSQAFADGYMRRHLCNECDNPFYTLADYEGKGYKASIQRFKDRALTPWEQDQRIEWAREAAVVTHEGNNAFATEFIETINIVFSKFQHGEDLAPKEHILIAKINQFEKEWSE